MGHQKVLNLLNKASNSKFVTRKWNIPNDQANGNYHVGNEIIYTIEVLKSNLCDYNDAYILIRSDITIIGHNVTQVAFKNCAPFTKCFTKSDGATVDYAEDLCMPMYNLIKYSSNYSDTTGSLWFYTKDEATTLNVDIENNNDFKSFSYEAKLLVNTAADRLNGTLRNAMIVVPLKYLSNFWRTLEMPLINCNVELKLKWRKYCVLAAACGDNANANPNKVIFTIKNKKSYVPAVILLAREKIIKTSKQTI